MRKIIFVDDDVLFLEILKLFFGPNPHQYVSDVQKVPPMMQDHGPFDVLVTDYNMPHQDGLSLAEWVHNMYPQMPILVVSAHRKPDILPEYIKDWILKPTSLEALDREIKKISQGFGAVEKT